MKKRKFITGISASLVIISAIMILFFAIQQDQNRQEKGIQEVTVENPTLRKVTIGANDTINVISDDQVIDTTKDLKIKNISSTKDTALGNTNDTLTNNTIKEVATTKEQVNEFSYNVVLKGTVPEDFDITIEEAAKLGMDAISETISTSDKNCKVTMSSLTLSGISQNYWFGVADIDSFSRCEFSVNATNGSLSDLTWYHRSNITSAWKKDTNDGEIEEYKFDEQNLDFFDSIDVNVDNANCELIPGDTFGLQIQYYGDSYIFHYDVADGIIKVKDERIKDITTWNQTKANTITITVPRNETIKNTSIQTKNGNVNINQMQLIKVNLETSNGNVSVNDTSCDSTYVTSMNGNLLLSNAITKDANLLTINGSINIDGTLLGKTSCNTTCGNITVTCNGTKETYSYDVKTSIGEVTIDGKTEKSPVTSYNGESNHIALYSSIGSCSLEFVNQ